MRGCLLHRRRRRAAALDEGVAGPRLRALAVNPRLQPRQGGSLPQQDRHQALQPGAGTVEGHGDPTPPGPDHGHRREAAGAGRADARPRPSVGRASSSTTPCSTTIFDHTCTIVITTHQVDEIQDILTDVMFINRGRIVLDCSMLRRLRAALRRADGHAGERGGRAGAQAHPRAPDVRAQHPAASTGRPCAQLAALGELRTPSIADLFVAVTWRPVQPSLQGAAA